MASIWRGIRTGEWLTAARLLGYATMAYAVAAVLWIALAHGLVDRNNKPIGADFSKVYAASTPGAG